MRRALTLLLILLSSLPATSASAHGMGAGEGVAAMPGLSLGATLYHGELDSPGFILGAEVSVLKYDLDGLGSRSDLRGYAPSAAGGYIDALWDFGADTLRVSLGPEVAWWFVGLDGGLVIQSHDGQLGYGVAGRLFVSAIVPGLYVRGGATWGEVDDSFVELGLTLKVPLLFD